MTVREEPAELMCPRCGAEYPVNERFCRRCRMPLVHAPSLDPPPAVSTTARERHERARKIKPQYGEGELVKVAYARNQVEAEFIQGLLLEEGVPSMLRRAPGFDVPDFLAAGPRDILVPQSGVQAARDVLLLAVPPAARAERASAARPVSPRPVRLFAALLVAIAIVGFVIAVIAALH
ncbi:MAG TPA: hypothetical protein VHX88_16960 [Solirubrobacteraceae bacterium]|jgi:hypothetical protein|nr:hypothetical protein [Solirubrobacteraceae bacterium]